MVLTDIKKGAMDKSLYDVDIFIHTLIVLQMEIMVWVVVKIS